MINYKMLVLDLDDTLLKSDRTISESTKEHLLRAQKNGIIIQHLRKQSLQKESTST